MKHRKGSYRFDVTADVREIEVALVENVRALGFETFAQVRKEIKRLGKIPFSRMTPREQASTGVLYNLRDAIDFVEHFDRHVESMLAGARKSNKNARRWIGEVAKVDDDESERQTSKAA